MEEVKKKKFPKWVIVLLVLFGFFIIGTAVVSFGIRYFLTSRGGERLAKEAAGKLIEQVINKESGGNVDVKIGEEGVTIQEKRNGGAVAFRASEKMPPDFPADIPVFSPAEFKGNVSVMGMQSFSWKSEKPASEVFQFYQSKMGANGWQTLQTSNREGRFSVSYMKGKRQVMLQVSGNDSHSNIQVMSGVMP